VVLLNVDRDLLERCLQRSPQAWEAFVDKFAPLVAQVVDYCAISRSLALDAATRDDLIAEVFLVLVQNDFAVLRRFRGSSSLATYLTVVSRRIAIAALRKNRTLKSHSAGATSREPDSIAAAAADLSAWENREQLETALESLSSEEAAAVRMFHLEGRSYREISSQLGMPENSIGPFLTRTREKLRKAVQPQSDASASG
jgi:RNA polymerase sigma-70 factor (ECF subfamily)